MSIEEELRAAWSDWCKVSMDAQQAFYFLRGVLYALAKRDCVDPSIAEYSYIPVIREIVKG